MKTFVLNRKKDPTGVSGTGIVAEGIEFVDGIVAIRWCVGDHRSTNLYASMEDMMFIHGHGSNTVVEWNTDSIRMKQLEEGIEDNLDSPSHGHSGSCNMCNRLRMLVGRHKW